MSILSNNSTFIHEGEELVLLPSYRFAKIELQKRLKKMNINYNNTQDKEVLKILYDSAIQDYKNRLKIIDNIRNDTHNLYSILNVSQRHSIPSNMNISRNSEQSKMLNISDDLNNLYGNNYNMQIKLNTNKRRILPNSYERNTSVMNSQNLNSNYNSSNYNNNYNFDNDNNYNYNNNKQINYGYESQNNNNFSNNNEYDYNNINNQADNYYKKINNQKSNYQYGEMNNNINNTNNYSQYPHEEKINIEEKREKKSYNFPRKMKFTNVQTIPESNNEDDSEKYNYNLKTTNIYNKPKQEKINIIPEKKFITPMNNIDENNKKSFTNIIYDNIEKYEAKNKYNNYQENQDKKEEKDNNNKKEEIITVNKDPDEVSTFSFFTAFENVKKNPLIKNWKFILIHLVILLSFLILSIAFLHLIYNSRESIFNFISNFFEFLCQPRRILDLIRSFISFIFFGSIRNWYIIIPIIILLFVLYVYLRKYLFKKRCKEIIEKIVKDLENSEDRNISEEDIYNKYVKNYGVSYVKFKKKYLPQLQKLRRNDNRLKISSIKNDEKTFVFWELSQ